MRAIAMQPQLGIHYQTYIKQIIRSHRSAHGIYRLAVQIGRFGAARVEREQRLCQQCWESSVDGIEHIIIDWTSLEAERQKHQSLFARGRVVLADFFK